MQGVSEDGGREWEREEGAVCMRREAWSTWRMARHGSGVLKWAVRHSFWRAMAAINKRHERHDAISHEP